MVRTGLGREGNRWWPAMAGNVRVDAQPPRLPRKMGRARRKAWDAPHPYATC